MGARDIPIFRKEDISVLAPNHDPIAQNVNEGLWTWKIQKKD